MPAVLDLIEPTLLESPPPRRLPLFFIPNLIGEYLLERPLRSYIDPIVVACLMISVLLALLQVNLWFWIGILGLLTVRIGSGAWYLIRAIHEDYLLLRHGLLLHAHIMSIRTMKPGAGRKGGAYLDCAIPITRARSSVGSVWIPDQAEAEQLYQQGRLAVICLPDAPGLWRLREGSNPHLRYEPARKKAQDPLV